MKNAVVGVFGKPKQSLSEVIGKRWRAILITYRFNHLILSQFFQHEHSEVYRLARAGRCCSRFERIPAVDDAGSCNSVARNSGGNFLRFQLCLGIEVEWVGVVKFGVVSSFSVKHIIRGQVHKSAMILASSFTEVSYSFNVDA